MKRHFFRAAVLPLLLAGLLAGCASAPQEPVLPDLTPQTVQETTAPSPSPEASPTISPTPSPTPSPSPTPTPTASPTPTPTPKATQKPMVLTEEKKEEILQKPVKQESQKEDETIQESRPTAPPIVDTVPTPAPTKTPSPTLKPSARPSDSPAPTKTPKPTPTPVPAYTGWKETAEGTFYLVEDKPVTGSQAIGGRRYIFDESGVLQTRTGVDVSSYQKNINWKAVAQDGISYAFIRIGGQFYRQEGGFYKDAYFEQNYTGARAQGLDVGVYFFSQATTVEEAREEALWVIAQMQGRPTQLPIVYDLEDPASDSRFHLANLNRQEVTDLARAFCETIEANGYDAMVYTNPDWIRNRLDINQLSQYPLWISHYTTAMEPSAPSWWRSWQYTSVGKVSGINGSVDMNVMR